MSEQLPERDKAVPQVLDYQSPGKTSDRYQKGTLPGTVGLLLLAAAIWIGSVADAWGILALLASLTCFCVQVVVSFYRVQIGSQKRLRVRPGPLALGLVPLALFLAIILVLPMLGSPKERAQRIKCASTLRQIGQDIALYQNDHGVWPQSLAQIMMGGDLSAELFVCPSSGATPAGGATVQEAAKALANPKHCSFVYFPPLPGAGDLSPDAILVVERMVNHEGEGMNVLFADGHVEWCWRPEAQRILSELQAGHNPPREPVTRPSTSPSVAPGMGGN